MKLKMDLVELGSKEIRMSNTAVAIIWLKKKLKGGKHPQHRGCQGMKATADAAILHN